MEGIEETNEPLLLLISHNFELVLPAKNKTNRVFDDLCKIQVRFKFEREYGKAIQTVIFFKYISIIYIVLCIWRD